MPIHLNIANASIVSRKDTPNVSIFITKYSIPHDKGIHIFIPSDVFVYFIIKETQDPRTSENVFQKYFINIFH